MQDTIWIIEVNEYKSFSSNGTVLADDQYIFSFRTAGTQDEAEAKADEILNGWLVGHPGRAASYAVRAWVPRLRD